MKIYLIVLICLLIVGAGVGLVFLALKNLQPSHTKNAFVAIPIITTIALVALLIAASCIPNTMDKLLCTGIQQIEAELNTFEPGVTNKVLDAQQLKELTANTKKMKKGFDNNVKVSYVAKKVGVGAYIEYIALFAENADEHIAHFEKENIPFTLHNIFEYTKEQTKAPILKVTKVFQVLIIIAVGLIEILNLILVFYFKNEQKNRKVVIAEDV